MIARAFLYCIPLTFLMYSQAFFLFVWACSEDSVYGVNGGEVLGAVLAFLFDAPGAL